MVSESCRFMKNWVYWYRCVSVCVFVCRITLTIIAFSQCIEPTNGNLHHNLDALTLSTYTTPMGGQEDRLAEQYPVLEYKTEIIRKKLVLAGDI